MRISELVLIYKYAIDEELEVGNGGVCVTYGMGVVLLLGIFGECNVIVTLSLDHATHEGRNVGKKEIFFCFHVTNLVLYRLKLNLVETCSSIRSCQLNVINTSELKIMHIRISIFNYN